jgi:lipopolysaccharide/colanic/teichoic acid biosynthesis glycosyltransferase
MAIPALRTEHVHSQRGRVGAGAVRALDVLVGVVLVVLAAPLLAAIALAVRWTSPGPVLARRPLAGRRSAPRTTFRTRIDGSASEWHRAIRTAAGGEDTAPFTPIGASLERTRLERLPVVLDLVAGRRSLLG